MDVATGKKCELCQFWMKAYIQGFQTAIAQVIIPQIPQNSAERIVCPHSGTLNETEENRENENEEQQQTEENLEENIVFTNEEIKELQEQLRMNPRLNLLCEEALMETDDDDSLSGLEEIKWSESDESPKDTRKQSGYYNHLHRKRVIPTQKKSIKSQQQPTNAITEDYHITSSKFQLII